MATDDIAYVSLDEAIRLHFGLMHRLGESRVGIDRLDLIESALARPKHASVYEDADFIRQAASLLFGLIKNHPWSGGNKRTATTILRRFMQINGVEKRWSVKEQIELVLKIESDEWLVNEIDIWLRQRVIKA